MVATARVARVASAFFRVARGGQPPEQGAGGQDGQGGVSPKNARKGPKFALCCILWVPVVGGGSTTC